MGLALVLIYVALNLLSPADLMPALYPYHPMVVLGLLNLPPALLARLQAPEIGKLRVQFTLVLLFFGFACIAWLPHRYFMGNVNTFLNLSPAVIAYFLGIVHLRTPLRWRMTRATLILVAFWILIGGILEWPIARSTMTTTGYVLVYNLYAPDLSLMTTQLRLRGLGMLNDPNNLGQYLLVILPMLYVSKKPGGLGLAWFAALSVTAIFLVGVYYTGSRGAAVGLILMCGLFMIRRFKTIGALLASGFGTVVLLVIQGVRGSNSVSMSSGMDRLAIWSDGMQYFKSSPLYGIGPGAFSDINGMTAHNSFLLVAAELGFVGFFLWLGIIVVTWIQLNRIPKILGDKNPDVVRWAIAMRLSLSGYAFTSFFLSRAYDLPLFLLLGMSGGVIIAAGGDPVISLRGSKWPIVTLFLAIGILVLIYVMLRLRAV